MSEHCHRAVNLDKVQELLRVSQWPELRRELEAARGLLEAAQLPEAAVLALQAGLPELAAGWAAESVAAGQSEREAAQVQQAAWLRLGYAGKVRRALAGAVGAREILMLGRAAALEGDLEAAQEEAAEARARAHDAGDAPALIAAVALLGELELRGALVSGSRTGAMSALNILAEGLRVAEKTHMPADPHVLALVALAQRQARGFDPSDPQAKPSPKSQATAEKALGRSLAYSPASVLALLTLGRVAEARADAEAGSLARGWWAWADTGGSD